MYQKVWSGYLSQCSPSNRKWNQRPRQWRARSTGYPRCTGCTYCCQRRKRRNRTHSLKLKGRKQLQLEEAPQPNLSQLKSLKTLGWRMNFEAPNMQNLCSGCRISCLTHKYRRIFLRWQQEQRVPSECSQIHRHTPLFHSHNKNLEQYNQCQITAVENGLVKQTKPSNSVDEPQSWYQSCGPDKYHAYLAYRPGNPARLSS